MDPVACLKLLESFIADGNYSGAVDQVRHYYSWRLRGGFEPTYIMPTTVGGDAAAESLAVRLADAIDDERGLTRGP